MGLGPRALMPAAALAVSIVVTAAGCGGSSGSGSAGRSGAGEFPGYIAQAESTFRPADFGIESWDADTAVAGDIPPPAPDSGEEAVAPDTIPGFRVQVAITEDIDRAGLLRDSLSASLPDEWVYVVHHPPYYKVRIGDFSGRHLAEGFLDDLKRHGYPDAWIVPDRVFRTPPPKPPPVAADSTAAPDSLR